MVKRFTFYTGIVLCLFLFAGDPPALAQDGATGFSPPGSLGGGISVSDSDRGKMVCTVSLLDPDGEMLLDKNTSVKIKIMVRNFTETHVLHPKLEIVIQPAGDARPIMRILWLKQIKPWDSVTREEVIIRHPEFPLGTLTYRIRAFDARLKMMSDATDLSFEVK